MAGRKVLLKSIKATRKNFKEVDIGAVIERVLKDGESKFRREMMSMQGKDYIDRYLQLIEYSVPKLSRVEKTGENTNPIQINFLSSASNGVMDGVKLLSNESEVIDITDMQIDG